MTTPTPTAQSSACADEVHAQFVRGSEQPVFKYRHTIVLEFSEPEYHRQYSANMRAMGGAVVAVSFNDALQELETTQTDLASAREDLAQAERARDTALLQLAQAIEILTDIQARVREVGV